ncbi:ATP-binding protein [Clostridium sp. Marseille-Q2269]|uniref:sensor histidine kinase n=1 Tax=Clostridium sp. Marseille-Q2269 TaxID=2942205 RepID=UPI0020741044|nr:ATP-binding protein [Clostridium sp. Marseille-Q2269]
MRGKFERKIVIRAILIAVIPIIISYGIFLYDKTTFINKSIKDNLYTIAFTVSHIDKIGEKLAKKENDMTIQKIAEKYVKSVPNADIIVIGDIDGVKYSHNDVKQIGDIFIGEDKKDVLQKGTAYYSITQGSIGVTLRRFEPVFYNNKRVGFVMVGKYYNDVKWLTWETQILYCLLFVVAILFTVIFTKYFVRGIKESMLNMEPEEIARLYKEKKIIIDNISDGIIALDNSNKVVEINENCAMLFQDFSLEKVLKKVKPYLESNELINMREIRINGKNLFVTINPIYEQKKYLGKVIIFTDKKDIKKIAKEITGADELVKDLRASIHEFKNKLHVILGLINIEQYDAAKKYIMNTQKMQESNNEKYSYIGDFYIRAMIISRKLIAKEKNIKFEVSEDSCLYEDHGPICSDDLITILGNLIGNAFEACTCENNDNKQVKVKLKEDDEKIYIEVEDNGMAIPKSIRNKIFQRGISSKYNSDKNAGIGLYLVKTKVELHEGIINLKEEKNEKKFIITLFKEER